MKKAILFLFIFLISLSSFSQKEYSVNEESYQLKTEVEGTIDLLWNTIDSEFRYFVKTEDDTIHELKNTKDSGGDYQNEYKPLLNNLTNNKQDTSKLKFTLFSLAEFFNTYNSSVDSNYTYKKESLKVNSRLGVFGGISNIPFVDNPQNETRPQFGVELELYDNKNAKRHAGFLQLTHILKGDISKYSTTEIALGYRFKFIYTEKFNMYASIKLATLNFSNTKLLYDNDGNLLPVTENKSATSFDAPGIFGLGADFKVNDNGFITFYYNELFAVSLDNQGNFSTNLALGYKFNL